MAHAHTNTHNHLHMFQSWKDFLQISSSCQWMRWTIVRWPSYLRSISGTVKSFRTPPSLWLCLVCRGIGISISLNLRASAFGCVNGILVHSNKHLSFDQLKKNLGWPKFQRRWSFWCWPSAFLSGAWKHSTPAPILILFIFMAFGPSDYQKWPEPKRFANVADIQICVCTVRSSVFGGRPVWNEAVPSMLPGWLPGCLSVGVPTPGLWRHLIGALRLAGSDLCFCCCRWYTGPGKEPFGDLSLKASDENNCIRFPSSLKQFNYIPADDEGKCAITLEQFWGEWWEAGRLFHASLLLQIFCECQVKKSPIFTPWETAIAISSCKTCREISGVSPVWHGWDVETTLALWILLRETRQRGKREKSR